MKSTFPIKVFQSTSNSSVAPVDYDDDDDDDDELLHFTIPFLFSHANNDDKVLFTT